jgi:DNA polymerase-3 subunit epsilon
MGLIAKEVFVCFDCEATGLNPEEDLIVEIAAVKFTFDEVLETFETLIDPGTLISPESMAIHHITDEMVKGKPKIKDVLPQLLKLIGRHTVVGHGIPYDMAIVQAAAKRANIQCKLKSQVNIDTLRLARSYGEAPSNSLEVLRKHFNIAAEGAHRAMNDVVVNIEVFKYLSASYKTTKQLFDMLDKPVELKKMPLGKHKGRPFKEIPVEYLGWAAHQDFDRDLMFSIKKELKKRKKGGMFSQTSNPFSSL